MSEKQTFEELRHKLGRIVGQSMGNGQIAQVIKERQRMGAFADRAMQETIIAILEYLESRDDEENLQSHE
ncbi:MAG TPA: hypothetical protein VF941_11760 [Clostridia bacterium]